MVARASGGRGMRLFGVGLIVATGLLGAAWIVPPMLDWSRYRVAIAGFAAQALGRPVRIDGAVTVSLLPVPVVSAAGVRLGDRGDGIALTAPSLRLRLDFAALLLGRVAPRDLLLRAPVITLPWPLPPAALAPEGLQLLRASSAHIERGEVMIGAVHLTGVNADLAAEAARGAGAEGALSVDGTARALGQRWRFSNRLGAPDAAGGAALDLTMQALAPAETGGAHDGAAPDAAAHFAGRLAQDGTLSGKLDAHAHDLGALTLAALPHIAASATGTLTLGAGPAQANLALMLDGIAVRAELRASAPDAARLGPVLALSTPFVDLDEWIKAMAHHAARPQSGRLAAAPGGLPAWPFQLDLSADALKLRGGTVRHAHALWALDGGRATLAAASALLPGEAATTLTGRLENGQPAGFAGAWTLDAPQLRATLDWLVRCGLSLNAPLPQDVLRTAHLAGKVTVRADQVALTAITGAIEQSQVAGALSVDPASGAIDADLSLDTLPADNWLPPDAALDWPALSRTLAGVALTLKLRAAALTWRGAVVANAAIDAATNAGGLAINGADADIDGLHAHLAGTLDPDGGLSQGVLDLAAASGTAFARNLPPWARSTAALWAGPVHLHVEAAGPRSGVITSLGLDLADARLEAHPTLDLTKNSWSTQMTLRHPGAPRLLAALGFADAGQWLGEGSLSMLAQLSGSPGQIRFDSYDLTAASLHATGGGQLTFPQAGAPAADPVLVLRMNADTLPLPSFRPRDHAPLRTGALAGLTAQIALTAQSVLVGQEEVVHGAQASLDLVGGIARLDLAKGRVGGGATGGGTITGALALDSGATPPRFAAQASITGATLAGPLFGTPIDLTAGRIDATIDLAGQGYSPASVLASLSGSVQMSAITGSITGIDLSAARAAGSNRVAVLAAFGGGASPFATLLADAAISYGVASLRRCTLEGPDGAAQFSGAIDLPGDLVNLLATLPDQRDVRLTGAIESPRSAVP